MRDKRQSHISCVNGDLLVPANVQQPIDGAEQDVFIALNNGLISKALRYGTC